MISFLQNRSRLLSSVLAVVAAPSLLSAATSVATVPVGYMKYSVAATATSSIGIPLDDTAVPSAGIRAGKIESFTVNTLNNSGGGWTSNLASATAPWLVRITSGPSAGKTLDITGNTATTLTISGADLTTLGLTAGTDTFELVPLDTLFGLFGSASLQGGTSAGVADNVQVRVGTALFVYYYDTNLGFWRRNLGPAVNANSVPVRPGAGVQIVRRGGAMEFTFAGRAPATTFRASIFNAGTTTITTGFPTDTTLGGLAAQTLLSGWRTGVDIVGVYNGTAWTNYAFNGSFWQPAAGPATNSDSISIPAGALINLQRPGATAGTTDLVRNLPYSL